MTSSGSPHGRGAALLRAVLTAVLLAAAIAALLVVVNNSGGSSSSPDVSADARAAASGGSGGFVPAQATIAARAPEIDIPRSFLGFSTEYGTLPTDAAHIALYERVVSLVRVPGDGRFVLPDRRRLLRPRVLGPHPPAAAALGVAPSTLAG